MNSVEQNFKKISFDVLEALELFENDIKTETDSDKRQILDKMVLFSFNLS